MNIKKNLIFIILNWRELKSIRDIQIFFRFANFYHSFIKSFYK